MVLAGGDDDDDGAAAVAALGVVVVAVVDSVADGVGGVGVGFRLPSVAEVVGVEVAEVVVDVWAGVVGVAGVGAVVEAAAAGV